MAHTETMLESKEIFNGRIIRVTVDEDTVDSGEAHLEYGAVRKRYKNQTSLS